MFLLTYLLLLMIVMMFLVMLLDRTDGVNTASQRLSGDWKESSPSFSAPGAKVRSLLPGISRPRSRSDLTTGGGGRPISVQPQGRRCSYNVQSETTTSDFFVEPESEGRRSRGLVAPHCTGPRWCMSKIKRLCPIDSV